MAVVFAILIYSKQFVGGPSRGSRAVKGAAFRSLCVVLRRFESCPLHHFQHNAEALCPYALVDIRGG